MEKYYINCRFKVYKVQVCFILFACLSFTIWSLYPSYGQIVPDRSMTSKQKVTQQKQINRGQLTTTRITMKPVKISADELSTIEKSLSVQTTKLTQSMTPAQTAPGVLPIEVTSPQNCQVWDAGKDYFISWRGANDDVRIDLEYALHVAGKPATQISITDKATNTGNYRFSVPYNWVIHPYGYRVRVTTLNGKQSGCSQGTIAVYTQPVDLECRVVDAYIKTDVDFYVVYAERDKWLEFNVLIRNKGVRSPVTIENVLVRIIKEPEEVVVAQEEWGFSGIYGHEWYKLPEPRKFSISHSSSTIGSWSQHVNLKNGAYRVEVELDPQNRLGENQQTREDNKVVKYWQIK